MKSVPVVLAALLLSVPALAQEEKPDETPSPQASPKRTASSVQRQGVATPLRVLVTVSRYEGDKKVSSLPYSLELVADHLNAHLRMGIELPVPMRFVRSTTREGEAPADDGNVPSQYRNVGTNLDCSAEGMGDGRYRVKLSVDQSSVSASREGGEVQVGNMPLFRSFKWSGSLLLRDGQTAQHVAATDPVTGASVRVDVALSVPK